MAVRCIVAAALVSAVLAACGGSGSRQHGEASAPVAVSSLTDAADDEWRANVDSSFYDFIYLFRADSAFQRSRTTFPLTVDDLGRRGAVETGEWVFDSLLASNVCYTVFNDSEESLDDGFDMRAGQLTLREAYAGKGIVTNYHFARHGGRWMLDSIAVDNPGDGEADFLRFYERFANDTVFQMSHVSSQLGFVTYDSGDEMSLIDATISREQWRTFRPDLSARVISGFDCTVSHGGSRQMIVTIVRIDTGYNVRLYFHRTARHGWMLVKYEDSSV